MLGTGRRNDNGGLYTNLLIQKGVNAMICLLSALPGACSLWDWHHYRKWVQLHVGSMQSYYDVLCVRHCFCAKGPMTLSSCIHYFMLLLDNAVLEPIIEPTCPIISIPSTPSASRLSLCKKCLHRSCMRHV